MDKGQADIIFSIIVGIIILVPRIYKYIKEQENKRIVKRYQTMISKREVSPFDRQTAKKKEIVHTPDNYQTTLPKVIYQNAEVQDKSIENNLKNESINDNKAQCLSPVEAIRNNESIVRRQELINILLLGMIMSNRNSLNSSNNHNQEFNPLNFTD